jgi:hypothetical protein
MVLTWYWLLNQNWVTPWSRVLPNLEFPSKLGHSARGAEPEWLFHWDETNLVYVSYHFLVRFGRVRIILQSPPSSFTSGSHPFEFSHGNSVCISFFHMHRPSLSPLFHRPNIWRGTQILKLPPCSSPLFIGSSKYFPQHISKNLVFGFPAAWETKFHTHKKNNKCIVLYILVSTHLDRRRDDGRVWTER